MSVDVFISYAQEDENYYKKLANHMSILKREGTITAWQARDVLPGSEWVKEIDTHLQTAQIILLLLSSDFIASDLCSSTVMEQAIARHEQGKARVIPIILRPVDWRRTPFARLVPLPAKGEPVSKWNNTDDAFLDIVDGLRRIVEALPAESPEQVTPGKEKDAPQETEQKTIHNIPFERNLYFTGREDILERLHTRLTTSKIPQPQVITGLGGIGKTQTAIEYAYRHLDDYQYVFWVRADTGDLLSGDFTSIAGLLNLSVKDEKDQSLVLSAVRQWLQTHTGWLLILDNADDAENAFTFLPKGNKGHILLTMRTPTTGTSTQNTALPDMAPEESILFLLRRAKLIELDTPFETIPETDRSKALEIAEAMGYLPLALVQAGSYIEETRCSLAGYLDRYKARRSLLLQERRGLGPEHPEPVATTWSLSFEKVEQASPAAADVLRLCAFLQPDAIPEELFVEGAAELGEHIQSAIHDSFDLDRVMEELLKYSLVRRNADASLTIHRLVQVVLKDAMDTDTLRQWAERVVRAVNRIFPDVEYEVWQRCKRYLPQAQACAELIDEWQMESEEVARLLDEAGDYLREQGKYGEAEPLLAKALAIREKILGLEHLDVALSLNNLARIYHYRGKYAQAESYYERALAIRKKVSGPESLEVAESLNDLAVLYSEQGKYAQAELIDQEVLAIRENVLGPDHPLVALSLGNLAGLYRDQGLYAKAEALYQRALALHEQVLGPDHPDVATGLGGLANLYQDQGLYTKAEPLYQRALALREQVLGPAHPGVASSLNNLASLYQAQRQYAKAEPLYQRALALAEQVLGPAHPNVARCLTNVAMLNYHQGKYVWAEQRFKRAQSIQESSLGPNHPDLAKTLNGLAGLYTTQGKYDKARPLFQRSIKIYEQSFGPEHPDLATFLLNYADMLRKAKRTQEAIALEERAAAIRLKHAQENPVGE